MDWFIIALLSLGLLTAALICVLAVRTPGPPPPSSEDAGPGDRQLP